MVAPTTESSSKMKMRFSLDDFRLSDAWEVVQRRWKTLAVSVLAMWALGILYCYVAKSTYESSSQVLVMPKQTSLVSSVAPANATGKSEVSEDLLATHMMIAQSRRIVDDALSRTIRKSRLEKLIAEQAAHEARDSTNLRFVVGRLTGAIEVPELPPTPPADAQTPPADGATAPATSPEAAAATDATATPGTAETPTPMTTAAPETAVAAATPTTPVPAVSPAAAPAATATAPLATPATVSPGIPGSETVAPATGTPESGTPTTPNDPTAVAATDPTAVTDPNAPTDPALPVEFRSTLDEAPQEPPGPTADGDLVLMLAELPGILSELGTGELPAQYVMQNLDVTRGGSSQARDSHVIGLTFRHKNSVEARLVLEALIKAYQNFLSEKFADVNREAAKLIEQASKDLEKELATAQASYQRFREQSPILFAADAATNVHRERYEAYQAELSALQVKLSTSRSRLEAVELALAMAEKNKLNDLDKLSLIDETSATRMSVLATVAMGSPLTADFQRDQTVATGIVNIEFGDLAKKKAELDAMLLDYGRNHPEVKKLSKAIANAEAFLNSEKARVQLTEDVDTITVQPSMIIHAYLRMLRNDVDSDQRREQDLMQLAAEEEERAKALVVYELEGQRLSEEVTRAQTLYDAVLDRLREIDLAKDYSGFVNEVIMAPEFGSEVWPSIPIVLVLCSLVGIAIGGGIAGVNEFRDRSFRDPEDIRRDLDMPLLTHVPDLRGNSAKQLVEGSLMHGSIYAFHRPKSRESEVFRGLRTSLFFSSGGQKCQVLMFTSPNQGDGKSTVAANLAVSIAQTGRKVLLVDCDLRRPNVHKLMGLNNETGLSDVINGEVEPWDAIQQTETANLWGLPAGPLPSNPAELLQSTTFEQFIKLAREKYDYVILDCPPVLAVADPCIVAPRADGITLVLRVSRDSKPQANRAKEMLARVNGRMLGVVVNASQEAAKGGYGKYGDSAYAYSYDYGYGKGYGRGYNKYYEEDSASQRANGSGR